ncbi:MAG: MFS transporter [Chloroflexi bacterium]|nr:MFS transporter [Chloroflexota bacterium]
MTVTTGTSEIKVYGYRWVVLLAFVFGGFMTQVFWICYAPINKVAAEALGVSDIAIGQLAMIFMYVFALLSLPTSWAVDLWGFKKSVSVGAILLGAFGLLRGIFALNWPLTVITTIGIALSQPFFLNASTKCAATWFRLEERATIVGLGGVAVILGIGVGQIATPMMYQAWGLQTTMLIYGVVGVISALVFLIFAKDHPPTPAGHEERALVLDGFKLIFKLRDFYFLAFVAFVVNAIFNGILTWVEVFVRPKGLDIDQAGLIGGLVLLGGIVGFLIFPSTSDRLRKRRSVLMVGSLLSVPFLVLLAYVNGFALLGIVGFLVGLTVMGLWPLTMQYSAEICYPAPEGTSLGVLNLVGQVSVVGVYAMGWSNEAYGSFTPSLLVCAVGMAIGAVLVFIMKESKLIQAAKPTEGAKP